MLSPFRIKVCGLLSASCVGHVVSAGADAIGLNFAPNSRRYLSPQLCPKVAEAIPQGIVRVGVFVNEPIQQIESLKAIAQLQFIQLHGDEPTEMMRDLPAGSVIRAIRLRNEDFSPITAFVSECERLDTMPAAILVDAHSPTAYGGTGRILDWSALSGWREWIRIEIPLILAGGLSPENVAEAIQIVQPAGVDTASGVETVRMEKDRELTAKFVSEAGRAFAKLRAC